MREQTANAEALARTADEVERRVETRAEQRSEVRSPCTVSAVSAVAHAEEEKVVTSRLAQPPTSELLDAPATASEGSGES